MRFGYVSQNLSLGVTTGHTVRLSGLSDVERVQKIVDANLDALQAIVRWNAAHDLLLFRMSSQIVPFASHPAFPYDWEAEHGDRLRAIGRDASLLGVRLSMHPDQFIQPGSAHTEVRERSLAELRYAARLLTLLGASDLVLHLGGVSGNRQAAAIRFVEALHHEDRILRFLAIENDERLWTVEDVLAVAHALRVPVILDTLHHALNPGRLTLREALHEATATWRRRPKIHLSSQDPQKQAGAHAWGVAGEDMARLVGALDGGDVDVMVEAKGKDLAAMALLHPAGAGGWG